MLTVQHMNQIRTKTELSLEEKYLSGFCRARGVRFFVAGGLFWMSRGMRLFSPWPSSRPIALTRQDLRFMWGQKAMFLHYDSKDARTYYPGYDLVVSEKNYDFGSITSSKRRHNIRWALKHCSVERIPFDLLVRESSALIEDTHQRQGRQFNESVLEMWKNYFRLAESNPLFEAWGAFVSNQMAACHVCITVDGGAYIEMTFSRSDLLRFHPVDALCFVFTRNAMNRDGVKHVSYGRRPITGEAEGLVDFKESMGFRKIPSKERVEINPIFKPLLCGPLRSIALNIAEKYSDRSMYARMIAGVTSTIRGQVKHSEQK